MGSIVCCWWCWSVPLLLLWEGKPIFCWVFGLILVFFSLLIFILALTFSGRSVWLLYEVLIPAYSTHIIFSLFQTYSRRLGVFICIVFLEYLRKLRFCLNFWAPYFRTCIGAWVFEILYRFQEKSRFGSSCYSSPCYLHCIPLSLWNPLQVLGRKLLWIYLL